MTLSLPTGSAMRKAASSAMATLIRIRHEQAEAAAAKISQFIKGIESQLGWTTQLPRPTGSIEQRRFDALRLLRQAPAITELAEVDSAGKERLNNAPPLHLRPRPDRLLDAGHD